MIHYGATLIQYIELSCFLGDGKFPQRPIVETVDVLDGIAHIHGDLLPGHEAQIPLLQKELILGVGDGFHPAGNLPLQIHQVIDVCSCKIKVDT